MNKKLLISKYVFFDIIVALVVWVLFMIFRRVVNDGQLFSSISVFVPNFNYYSNLFLFPILCVAIHYLSGYYVNPIKESKITEFFTTFFSSAIIFYLHNKRSGGPARYSQLRKPIAASGIPPTMLLEYRMYIPALAAKPMGTRGLRDTMKRAI